MLQAKAVAANTPPGQAAQPKTKAGLQKETKRTKAEQLGERSLELFSAAFLAVEPFVFSFP